MYSIKSSDRIWLSLSVWKLPTGTVCIRPFLSGLMTSLSLSLFVLYIPPVNTIFGCFQTLGQRRDINCCLAYKLRIYIMAILPRNNNNNYNTDNCSFGLSRPQSPPSRYCCCCCFIDWAYSHIFSRSPLYGHYYDCLLI